LFLSVSMNLLQMFKFPLEYRIPVLLALVHLDLMVKVMN